MMTSHRQQEREFKKRIELFLQESNALDPAFAPKESGDPLSGHNGAILSVLQKAKTCSPVTLKDILDWQCLLADQSKTLDLEQSRGSEIETLLQSINQIVQDTKAAPISSQIVSLIADALISFEALHPFDVGTGQVARLLANYIATCFRIPWIIFRVSEQKTYQEALMDPFLMRLYIAEKLKESIFDAKGWIFSYVQDYGDTVLYKSSLHEGQEMVEWHELNQAIGTWEKKKS